MIKFQILTVFPQIIEVYLSQGIMAQALKKGLYSFTVLNPRDFAEDNYKSIDDRPFGGGDGMVMLPELIEATLNARPEKTDRVIYLTPQGKPLDEMKVKELAQEKALTLICGRYGGIDQRVLNEYVDEEISLGDFVLSGGELAALSVMDAVVRKIPGSLGHQDSAEMDSFSAGLLEHPLFTRPQEWNRQKIPAVLLSGHHEKIEVWKLRLSQLITLKKRPELLQISPSEKRQLRDFYSAMSDEDKKNCSVEGLDGQLSR